MRYLSDHKRRTHERIVQAASRLFRRHGVTATGVAPVMLELGLTHGGFYAHFRSKEDLVVEAIQHSMSEMLGRFRSAMAEAPPQEGLRVLIDTYLSPEHRDAPAAGCPVAAMAPELGRLRKPVLHRLSKTWRRYIAEVTALIQGESVSRREDRAMLLLSGMAGCLALSRLATVGDESDRILAAGRQFYRSAFTGPSG